MGVFLLCYASLSALILAFHIALAAGLVRNGLDEARRRRGTRGEKDLRAEVIVALRNEQETLPALLASLWAQTRTDTLFLFVDDRSSDATGRILDEFCASVGPRARVIHNANEPRELTGKQAALDLAFDACRGDVLLFTDGDCVVPPGWVDGMLACFQEPEVGIVLGRIELPSTRGFLGAFQAFEQPLLNQYNLGSVGIGVPTGCFGNNMAVRAAALRPVGGFRTIGYSVTEDAMLLDAVCRSGAWKARARVVDSCAARTVARRTWAEFVNQHTRWNAGGLFAADFVTRFFYFLVVVIYLTSSIVFLPLGLLDWRIPALCSTSFVSIGLLGAIGGLYPGKRKIRYFLSFLPFLVFFGFFYVFVTLRALLERPFEWKGRALRSHAPAGRP
ncbi:MAG TPA: glycosyltransferase [Spirochaetia bacterium]|nr:glycosyltransferase [Spirochaetia bacterium]